MGRETSVVWSLIVWYFRAKRMMHIKPPCKTHPLFLKLISHFSDDLWMKSFSRFIRTAIVFFFPILIRGQGQVVFVKEDFWVFKHQMEEVGIIQICKVGLKTLGVFGWKSRRAVSLLNIKVQPTNLKSWPPSQFAFLSDLDQFILQKNTGFKQISANF